MGDNWELLAVRPERDVREGREGSTLLIEVADYYELWFNKDVLRMEWVDFAVQSDELESLWTVLAPDTGRALSIPRVE